MISMVCAHYCDGIRLGVSLGQSTVCPSIFRLSGVFLTKNLQMAIKIVIFKLKNIDTGAKFG